MASLSRLVYVLLGALWLCGCSDDPSAALFRVVGVEPGNGALARNEAIALRFDRPPADEVTTSPLLRLRDARGELVPFRAATSGRSLILRPGPSGEWPADSELSLELKRGLALSVRAVDGSKLDETFRHRFQVGSTRVDQGVPLRLDESPELDGRPLGSGSELTFRFNLPLDPASLAEALRLESAPAFSILPPFRLEESNRRLVVIPFARPLPLPPGGDFTLRIGAALRSSGGARPAGGGLEFELKRSLTVREEGVLTFDFRSEALPVADNPPVGAPGRGALPQRGDVRAVILNDEALRVSPRRRDAAEPFSRAPSRRQVLLAAEGLGEDPGLITGFSFCVWAETAAQPFFPRFLIRVGLLPEGRMGLAADFGANFAASPAPVLTLSADSVDGEWRAEAKLRSAGAGRQQRGWLDLDLKHPFPYPGGGRDLVVELENGAGAFPRTTSEGLLEGWRGFSWVGILPKAEGPAMTLFESPESNPTPGMQVFATKVRIERYLEYTSAWQEASVPSPRFFRVPADGELEARGVREADFRFDFQGRRADGSLTSWGRLEGLTGCRSIRCRLHFLPGSGRAAAGEVEVKHLRVRYERNE